MCDSLRLLRDFVPSRSPLQIPWLPTFFSGFLFFAGLCPPGLGVSGIHVAPPPGASPFVDDLLGGGSCAGQSSLHRP